MIQEIQIASDFISSFIPSDSEWYASFKERLYELLSEKIHSSWYPESPLYGSGYRAVNIVNGNPDTILYRAWLQATPANIHNLSTKTNTLSQISPVSPPANKLSLSQFSTLFPGDLVVWIDPGSVSYRKGDFGFPLSLYEAVNASAALPMATPPRQQGSSSREPMTPDMYTYAPHHLHPPATNGIPMPLYQDSQISPPGFQTVTSPPSYQDADYHQKHSLGVYSSPPQSPRIHKDLSQQQAQQPRRSRALEIRAPPSKSDSPTPTPPSSYVSVVS